MRKISISLSEYYHIYSRGVDKRVIFLDEADYSRFQVLLFLCNQKERISLRDIDSIDYFNAEKRGEAIVAIGAWCLMPNHIHLFAKEVTESGISTYMGKVLTAYSMYFNKKYGRTGSLFESTYKAEHVDSDEYMRYLPCYIHLNCLSLTFPEWKSGLVDVNQAKSFLDTFQYSSFLDYKNGTKRPQRNILNPEAFPEYHKDFDSMLNECIEWIQIKNEYFT